MKNRVIRNTIIVDKKVQATLEAAQKHRKSFQEME